MNRSQIALKLALEHIGIPQKVDTFDDRLILQKSIYLVQQAGVPLGYHYSWYIRGPYSSALTSDIYETWQEKVPDGWKLGDDVVKNLSHVKNLIQQATLSDQKARTLENLASILFIIKTGQAAQSATTAIKDKMIAAGKMVTEKQVEEIISNLKQHGLL